MSDTFSLTIYIDFDFVLVRKLKLEECRLQGVQKLAVNANVSG